MIAAAAASSSRNHQLLRRLLLVSSSSSRASTVSVSSPCSSAGGGGGGCSSVSSDDTSPIPSSPGGIIIRRGGAHHPRMNTTATTTMPRGVGMAGIGRFKSTAPEPEHEETEIVAEESHPAMDHTAHRNPDGTYTSTHSLASSTTDATTTDDSQSQDYTSDRSKSGTPSPWAIFDAWGVSDSTIQPHLTPSESSMLEPSSVSIPFDDDERSELPDESSILEAYDKHLKHRSSAHFGYPYNLIYNHEELYEFMKYSINNLGDPYITSNYGVHSRQFECSVIDFFAKLWKMPPDQYWGYVTTCGTEGNLHGILLAREVHPDGILYSSRESHYSVFKAARYYRMDAKSIPTLPMGEIDYDLLGAEISKNLDRPVIINVNIGTTVKGAVDNLDRILRILKNVGVPRERFHIHCDGALFAMMMPFVDYAPTISFEKPIDSIAVSGHKMLGCPMPCGIALSRKEHVKKVENKIEYLNSVDTTIMGSRNGQAALYLWYSLRKKGISGIKQDVVHCMETAIYLRDKITTDAGMSCRLNDLSCTVVLERPMDDAFVKRWQLACEEDIAHVVVMPNVTRQKIDKFVEELVEQRDRCGRRKPAGENSPLMKLGCNTWGGSMVEPIGVDLKSDA